MMSSTTDTAKIVIGVAGICAEAAFTGGAAMVAAGVAAGTVAVVGVGMLAYLLWKKLNPPERPVTFDVNVLERNYSEQPPIYERINPLVIEELEDITSSAALPTNQSVLTQIQEQRHVDAVNKINFALLGAVKRGKSSLCNGIRGLKQNDPNAAAVDVVECTKEIQKYPIIKGGKEIAVIHDIPGAATLNHPIATYFIDYALFVFDFLFIIIDCGLDDFDRLLISEAIKYGRDFAVIISRCDQRIDDMKKIDSDKTCDELKSELRLKVTQQCNSLPLELRDGMGEIYFVSCHVFSDERNNARFAKYKMDEEKLVKLVTEKVNQKRSC